MRNRMVVQIVVCLLAGTVWLTAAQSGVKSDEASAAPALVQGAVPKLIRFNGVVNDAAGKPAAGTVTLTFALYEDAQGGTPLWMERQQVSQLPAR